MYTTPAMREISDDFSVCWSKIKSRHKGCGFPRGCRNKILFQYDLLFSYELYIPSLLQLIPTGNLFIGDYALYKDEASAFYKQVFEFLGMEVNFQPHNKKMNKSYAVSSTTLARALAWFAIKTARLRIKIGLTGRRLYSLKKFAAGKRFEPKNLNSCDEQIRACFSDTYEYLKNINWGRQ